MKKFYRIAGIPICVEIPDPWMYESDLALAPFRVDAAEDPHCYHFSIVDALTVPGGSEIAAYDNIRIYEGQGSTVRYIGSVRDGWENAYIRAAHRGKDHDIQLRAGEIRDKVRVKMVLNALGAEHLIVQSSGFILHASCIERNGKAVVFTAPSGTGKSTQAALWEALRGAEIINGDRIVLQVRDGRVLASGIPFAGSSPHCLNRTLPLAAIVCLNQAPQTRIRQLDPFGAFRRVWEGICVNTWDEGDINLAMDTLQTVLGQVPVYALACRKDESAVIALEQMLGK